MNNDDTYMKMIPSELKAERVVFNVIKSRLKAIHRVNVAVRTQVDKIDYVTSKSDQLKDVYIVRIFYSEYPDWIRNRLRQYHVMKYLIPRSSVAAYVLAKAEILAVNRISGRVYNINDPKEFEQFLLDSRFSLGKDRDLSLYWELLHAAQYVSANAYKDKKAEWISEKKCILILHSNTQRASIVCFTFKDDVVDGVKFSSIRVNSR